MGFSLDTQGPETYTYFIQMELLRGHVRLVKTVAKLLSNVLIGTALLSAARKR
jgi:hypothetical protein